eukprot:6989601-Pyramimonas_sp.AAC.1
MRTCYEVPPHSYSHCNASSQGLAQKWAVARAAAAPQPGWSAGATATLHPAQHMFADPAR